MVKALHRAGIEVILDVVYNHTAEGNQLGPTLSFRGIDNTTYYRLVNGQPRYYMDYTGTGNTLNVRHPQVLKLIMDSLRYWVQEMHVDGFRFDLAAALARELHEVDRLSAFFDIINQDPVISQVKLIAEPWDVGEGGYQVGKFPPLWAEWNGRYRDVVRRYWKGDDGPTGGTWLPPDRSQRSLPARRPPPHRQHQFHHRARWLHAERPGQLRPETQRGQRRREPRRLQRQSLVQLRRGRATDDPGIVEIRERQKRNFLLTLLLSQGVPMICGGDEIGRTQRGNNNAYAQDNATAGSTGIWTSARKSLLRLHREAGGDAPPAPQSASPQVFSGPRHSTRRDSRPRSGWRAARQDIVWLRPDGKEMTPEEWSAGWVRCIGLRLNGRTLDDVNGVGEPIRDDTFLILLNPHTRVHPLLSCPGARARPGSC